MWSCLNRSKSTCSFSPLNTKQSNATSPPSETLERSRPGTLKTSGTATSNPRAHYHGDTHLDLAVTPDILARWADLLPAELTFQVLAYRIAGLRAVGLPDTRWAMEWHRRVAFPVAGWVLSLVGLVVGVWLRPSRAAYPVIFSGAVALGVAFAWWLGYEIVAAYASVGTLSPWMVRLPAALVVLGGLVA